MSSTTEIIEGFRRTERLSLYTLLSRVHFPKAPKVLLLGGSNFDLRLKRSFLSTPLASVCDIATYEPRGIGRTEQPSGDWSMQDYALDALSLLDSLGWSKVVVLAESFGGMTALHLIQLANERISKMIIASATAGGPFNASFDITHFLSQPRSEAAKRSLFLQDSRNEQLQQKNPKEFNKLLKKRIAFEDAFSKPSIDNGGYQRLLSARRHHDCTRSVSQITHPVTIIAGRYDQQAPFSSQQALAKVLPNVSFHAFDAGHGLLFNEPAATEVAMREILSS